MNTEDFQHAHDRTGSIMDMLRLPDRQIERRKLAIRSQDSEACGRCGKSIAPDEPVARGIVWSHWNQFTGGTQNVQGSMCFDCAGITIKDEDDTWLVKGQWRESLRSSCKSCGRGLVRMPHVAPYCSESCRREHYNRRRREIRARAREKVCAVCGEGFTATRSDAKTCSAACKQKGYRERRARPTLRA